jgi:hypothetical protein
MLIEATTMTRPTLSYQAGQRRKLDHDSSQSRVALLFRLFMVEVVGGGR